MVNKVDVLVRLFEIIENAQKKIPLNHTQPSSYLKVKLNALKN